MADKDNHHSVDWQSGNDDAKNGTYQNIVTHVARTIMGRQEDHQEGYDESLKEQEE